MAGDTLRVFLVEDSDMYREGLRAFLESFGPIDVAGHPKTIEVVREARTRAEAVQWARQTEPDLVLVDLRLPDPLGITRAQEGIAAIGEIRTVAPRAKMLVVTMRREERWARKAMDAGAKGYVVKDSDDTRCHMRLAIQAVANGGAYVCPSTAEHLRDLVDVAGAAVPEPLRGLNHTNREILRFAVDGLENEQIAARLGLAPHSVRNRLAEMKAEFNLGERRLLNLARTAFSQSGSSEQER
jgi:DNA-binding NarL/FixJ family response regulator